MIQGNMGPIHRRQCAPPFGLIADVLFQIIINGDASTILTLCLINKTTFDTIKVLEPHICKWFMRLHDIDTFSPLLTLNPWTGKQNALTVHTLVRSLYRHNVARCLSRQIVPSVWGPFYDDDKAEMNFEAELKLANRLERGFHVLFHMADISRDIKRGRQFHRKASLSSSMSKRLTKLHKRLKEYSDMNFDFNSPDSNNNNNYYYYQKLLLQPDHTKPRSKSHTTEILKWAQTESEIGQRRLDFRANHLDEKSEVAFHCTLRMLRELLERIVLRHGPRLWHRDTRNEYSVVSWFLLNQGPRDLAKLVLTPQDECCHYHFHPDPSTDGEECLFSNPLDEYWDAWKDSPGLGCAGARKGACVSPGLDADTYADMGIDIRLCRSINMRIGKISSSNSNSNTNTNLNPTPTPMPTSSNPVSNCNCKRRVRSWSVKPALFDNQGRGYNRAAERYLKEMWGQRHVGLHQAFTMGIFATVF